MDVVVFEDKHVDKLNPIVLGRPAFQIICGSYTLVDRLRALQMPIVPIVRSHLHALVQLDHPDLNAQRSTRDGALTLLVNARLVPSRDNLNALMSMVSTPRFRVVWGNVERREITAALVPTDDLPDLQTLSCDTLGAYLDGLAPPEDRATLPALDLLEYPHDVIRYNETILSDNLAHRIDSTTLHELRPGVFVGENVHLDNCVTVDTSVGPIVLDRGVSVGAHAYLRGPLYIGPATRVIEHAAIKHAVSIGHTAKIGGEVEASVIEPYSNKQHHGFLGHSYLGSWINLGAGTCNSDLKNTYGLVNVDYGGRRVATGMQFVGCVIGDYSKTAINTGIFTGKMIGVCSMLYGFVTTNVPSFVNYARSFGQVTQLPPDVMISTQRRMFARRNVEQRPCDSQLIRDMFILTNDERRAVVTAEAMSL